jgi:hypothetical protein
MPSRDALFGREPCAPTRPQIAAHARQILVVLVQEDLKHPVRADQTDEATI